MTRNYEVASLAGVKAPRAFVEQHHYSGSWVADRFRFGLFTGGRMVGVAVFSMPCHPAVLTNWLPCDVDAAAELGRFVLLDEVPANGESWFLARCSELLRAEGIEGFLSFSDPVSRPAAGGEVFPGHVGTIYQASNAVYAGRSRAQTLLLLPDGRVFSHRNRSKIVSGAAGWRKAAATLEDAGARQLEDGEDRRAWLAEALRVATRSLRHPGNHRYVFGLTPGLRRMLRKSVPWRPYPKTLG